MLVYQNSTEINLHIRVNVSHQHSECNRSVLHIYRKHSLCIFSHILTHFVFAISVHVNNNVHYLNTAHYPFLLTHKDL